ncbi:MAG: ABC transporter substrate-binding protein [Oceanospirillaceae bacterium]|nr:ABC transporter substrate-binding protein [Oceanospirillaceae bacterium]
MKTAPLSRPAMLLLAISLTVLGIAYVLLRQPSTPLAKLSIAVSRTPLSTPIYVAAAKGFFRQQGLDVALDEIIGGNRAFDRMIEGHADLATSSDSVVIFRSFQRRDFVVLASFVTSDNDVKLLASADGPLRDADDLANSRIAVTPQSASEHFLHNVALMHGIGSETIDTLDVNPEDMDAGLLENNIQALSTWEPYGYTIARELGEKAVVLPTRGLHSTSFNLIATEATLQGKREFLVAAMRAIDQAIDFMHQNPKQAQAIIRQQLDLETGFVDWVWPDYNFRLGLPSSLLISLDSGARWALNNGHVEPQPLPDFRELLDGSLLQQVIPAVGQR